MREKELRRSMSNWYSYETNGFDRSTNSAIMKNRD